MFEPGFDRGRRGKLIAMLEPIVRYGVGQQIRFGARDRLPARVAKRRRLLSVGKITAIER
ncbi:hypothetical protein [Sphingomonas sp. GC_Shp_3]|uniref:hypothetical protein n=1 Tax=Sphingomonas sp. GC_Shp_3 TaxID=2937383 RepID=UPI00226A3B3E|nr:hypothetical protein [Sphingomonas sp. GC_Shp_3]